MTKDLQKQTVFDVFDVCDKDTTLETMNLPKGLFKREYGENEQNCSKSKQLN